MINITLNGSKHHLKGNSTVQDLIFELDLGNTRFAIEYNEEILPRSKHSNTILKESDVVEIINAVGGG